MKEGGGGSKGGGEWGWKIHLQKMNESIIYLKDKTIFYVHAIPRKKEIYRKRQHVMLRWKLQKDVWKIRLNLWEDRGLCDLPIGLNIMDGRRWIIKYGGIYQLTKGRCIARANI
jgi:hypothetical protein